LWEVPNDWKNIYVTPTFRKVKPEDLGKYELISLTSVLVQVMQ